MSRQSTPSAPRRAFARAAAAGLLTAAVAFGLATPTWAQPRVLTVGNPFAPLSMDPSLSGNGRAGTHLMPAYEPLIRTRADGSFEPALATAAPRAPASGTSHRHSSTPASAAVSVMASCQPVRCAIGMPGANTYT